MNEKLSRILHDPRLIPAGVGLAVGMVSGTALGYFLAKRQRNVVEYHEAPPQLSFDLSDLPEGVVLANGQHVSKITNKIIEDIPEDGRVLPREEWHSEVVEADKNQVDDFLHKLIDRGMVGAVDGEEIVIREVEVEVEQVVTNVFESNIDWDFDAEAQRRAERLSENEPYVIHRDEFFENENEYAQRVLTYYVGDDILADEDDNPVYNWKLITGDLVFGHGSGDPDVVYIQNDKNKAMYEINRNPDTFVEVVHGLSPENSERVKNQLKHSVPRMRPE